MVCKKVHVHPELCALADEQLSKDGDGIESSGWTKALLSVLFSFGFRCFEKESSSAPASWNVESRVVICTT